MAASWEECFGAAHGVGNSQILNHRLFVTNCCVNSSRLTSQPGKYTSNSASPQLLAVLLRCRGQLACQFTRLAWTHCEQLLFTLNRKEYARARLTRRICKLVTIA